MGHGQDLLTILWFVLDCPVMGQEAKLPRMNTTPRIKDPVLTPSFVGVTQVNMQIRKLSVWTISFITVKECNTYLTGSL